MAANKRAGSKGATRSVKAAKPAPKKSASPKKAAAPKKASPKKASPKKAAPKKAAPPKKPAPKKAAPPKPNAKKPAQQKLAPQKVAPQKVAPQKVAPQKLAPQKVAPRKVAPQKKPAPQKVSAPVVAKVDPKKAPAPAASMKGSGKVAAKSPAPKASKPGDPRVAIPPPPRSAKPTPDKGLTKPGALGSGPVRLIPASTASSKGLPAPVKKPAAGSAPPKGQGLTLVRRTSDRPATALPAPVLPIPVRSVIAPLTIEDRAASIEKRLAAQTDDFRKRYFDSFDMSWIYHDSALEGVVYTLEELKTGLTPLEAGQVPDSSLQPAADEIRRHKEAIEFVRDFGTKKRLPVTIDVIKKIYLILHPSEGDLKTVKYRKDIPQHRLYFHEYAPPDKIAYKVRQIVDWLNEPETKKTRNALRIAARAHYDLLRVFPFQTDSGKVARLFMNLLLMRAGYPPSLIHSTERQRYYDALKGSANIVLAMVQESVENALSSVEKLLDEHETKTRGFVN